MAVTGDAENVLLGEAWWKRHRALLPVVRRQRCAGAGGRVGLRLGTSCFLGLPPSSPSRKPGTCLLWRGGRLDLEKGLFKDLSGFWLALPGGGSLPGRCTHARMRAPLSWMGWARGVVGRLRTLEA